MNNPREKNLMMIVLRPDGENCDVLKPAGKVHLSSTVFSSYPAWIYPVRSSCSKYQRQPTRKSLIGGVIRKLLDKWEEGSDRNLIFADHSLYWIVPPLLVQSIEVVCYIPKPEKIPGFTWIYFMSYLQLVISISVNNNHESTFALHLLFLCELDQSGLLPPSLPLLPGRIFFNHWK